MTRGSGASRASPLAWDEDRNGPGGYALPPCVLHELDPGYLGLRRDRDPAPTEPDAGENRESTKRSDKDAPDATMPRAAGRK
jgi:hypothetical protein